MDQSLSIYKNERSIHLFTAAYEKVMEHWQVPFETIEIHTDFGDCHVIASGPKDGKPLLLFHGMTGNSSLWFATVNALQTYRTYAIDAPGDFGKSTVKKPIKTPADAAEWVDQVMDALKLQKASFIGHSMGGWFCANYAMLHQEKVDRLILLAPVATFLPIPFFKMLFRIYPAMLRPSPDRIRRAWQLFCAKSYSLPDDIMDMIITAYTHLRSRLSVIPRVYKMEEWRKIKLPVLFLVGDEEKIYKADRVCQRVSEVLPHAQAVVIPRAGHCLTIEQPELVNARILDFI